MDNSWRRKSQNNNRQLKRLFLSKKQYIAQCVKIKIVNKTIALVVGIVFLLAAVVFIVNPFKKTSQNPQEMIGSQMQEQPASESNSVSFSGTIKDLFTKNQPMQCTFSWSDEDVSSSGTVYVAGSKMHGNFQTKQGNEEPYQSYIIQDGEYQYAWSPVDANKGMKMKISDVQMTETTPMAKETPTNEEQVLNWENQNVDYNCQPWTVDESKFVPPSNVEFTDLNEQMQKATEQMKGQIDCSICEQIPTADAKAECLQSLGCE